MQFERTIEPVAEEIARTFRAMVVCGPRQVGKTWLLKKLSAKLGGYHFVSLDDAALCEQAKNDPKLFLQLHPAPLFIDEVQRAPELFPEMKMILDGSEARGQYLMTGSQQFKVMKGAKESLAGRIGILRLQGLSKAEIEGRAGARPFVPSLEVKDFGGGGGEEGAWDVRRVYELIVKGGYPECWSTPRMNVGHYFASYIETYIERDIREMVDVTNIGKFRTFMRVCAARTGQLLNYADLARDAGISTPTARTWLSMLEASGIVYILYPYYNNMIKRVVKTPKLYFTDAGLCAHLLGITSAEAAIDSPLSGALLETYVVMEICKSHWYAGTNAAFWFYRDANQHEVDLILDYEGRLYPIEIKRAAAVKGREILPNMNAFRETTKSAAVGAVVLLSPQFGAIDSRTALIPIDLL
jgi:uncharacterized protein